MKKHLWIFAAAAAALAACSNDDTIAVNQGIEDANAISFRPIVNNLTRAADIVSPTTSAGLTAFNVTAYTTESTPSLYFDNVTFSKISGTANFGSTNKYYWPSSTNLNFFAYAPVNNQVNRTNYQTFTVTPAGSSDGSVAGQADFIYGVTENWGKLSTDNGGVEGHIIPTATGVTMNFRHAESKVLIQLKNSNPNLKITVGDVTLGNVWNKGQFTWSGSTNGTTTATNTDANLTGGYLNGTWAKVTGEGATAKTTYTIAMGTDDIDEEAAGTQARNVFDGEVTTARDLTNTAANHEMILVPIAYDVANAYNASNGFDGAYIQVQIKIQNAQNGTYIVGGESTYETAMWPLYSITWLPGHKYTYTVDLAGGGYYPTNQPSIGTGTTLDPILSGAEIKFVTVTVDAWGDGAETSVYTTGL